MSTGTYTPLSDRSNDDLDIYIFRRLDRTGNSIYGDNELAEFLYPLRHLRIGDSAGLS